jgi:hypothetical protein
MPEEIKLPKGYKLQEDTIEYPKGYMPYTPTFGPSTTSPRVTPESQRATPEDISQTATKAAPYVGRLTASALPAVGAVEGPLGVLVGSATSNALKGLFPGIFGEAGSGPQQLMNTGADLLFQSAVPSIASGIATEGLQGYARRKAAQVLSSRVGSAMPSVRRGIYSGLAEKVQGRYLYPESQIIETAAANAQAGIPGAGGRITREQFERVQAFPELQNVPYQQTGASQQSIKAITDKALSDVNQARNFKLATGEPDTIRHLAANEILTDSMKGGKLNSTTMLDKLTGPKSEIYKEAMQGHYDNFKELADTLEKYKTNPTMDSLMRYEKSRLILSTGSMLLGGGILGTAGKAIGGMVLGDAVLGRLMSNPQTAQMVIQALKTPMTAPQAPLLAKGLAGLIGAGAAIERVPEK